MIRIFDPLMANENQSISISIQNTYVFNICLYDHSLLPLYLHQVNFNHPLSFLYPHTKKEKKRNMRRKYIYKRNQYPLTSKNYLTCANHVPSIIHHQLSHLLRSLTHPRHPYSIYIAPHNRETFTPLALPKQKSSSRTEVAPLSQGNIKRSHSYISTA